MPGFRINTQCAERKPHRVRQRQLISYTMHASTSSNILTRAHPAQTLGEPSSSRSERKLSAFESFPPEILGSIIQLASSLGVEPNLNLERALFSSPAINVGLASKKLLKVVLHDSSLWTTIPVVFSALTLQSQAYRALYVL